MSTNPPPGSGSGPESGPGMPRPRSGFEEVIDRIEAELRQAVTFVNDAVVPHVRRESITAMRRVSDTLRTLADRFEASGNRQDPSSDAGQNPQQNPSNPNSSNKDPRS